MQPSGSADRRTYIPAHVEKAMTKQIQQMMPAHMKQYAGPYMQQNVMNQKVGLQMTGQSTGRPANYRPVTTLPRDSHYHQFGHSSLSNDPTQLPGQSTPTSAATMPESEPSTAPVQGTQYSQAAEPVNPTQSSYEFIMNPPEPPKKSRLPGGGSLLSRIALVGGGLVVLLIIANVVRGALSGPSPFPSYVSILQDQQVLIYLSTKALEEDSLSNTNRNFASTAQLSMTSSQAALTAYLATNDQTVDAKVLNAKVSPELDKRLQTALAATTYNNTFQEIAKTTLVDYTARMQRTYDAFEGKNGRDLLAKDYKQAELLLEQLNQADSN